MQFNSAMPPDAQDFCLNIDSHMKFNQDWDIQLMDDWYENGIWLKLSMVQAYQTVFLFVDIRQQIHNENAILTTYVNDHTHAAHRDLSIPLDENSPGARAWDFYINSGGIPRIKTGAVANFREPLLHIVWCAGFAFGRCE